jgi:hypothetical protein
MIPRQRIGWALLLIGLALIVLADIADKALIDHHGRVINVTGMVGVLAGTVLFTFAIVLILFRRGFGLDIPNSIHWFW